MRQSPRLRAPHRPAPRARSSPISGPVPPSDRPAAADADRLTGWLLFLPVPVVLVLFTRLPLGPYLSVGLGLAVMLTHPLYARRWAVRQAPARCLWCGGRTDRGERRTLAVDDPRGTVAWGVCSGSHLELSRRALSLATRMRGALRLGILGALLLSLPGILLGAAHRLGAITPQDASAFFRLAVALSVLPLGWLGMPLTGVGRGAPTDDRDGPADERGGPRDNLRAPFPLHIAALPGIAAVLWLFRGIGLVWLVQGVRHFLSP